MTARGASPAGHVRVLRKGPAGGASVRKVPRERVVITGLGMVTPLGLDVASSWAGLLAGQSGVARVRSFDASTFRCQIAAELKGFEPAERMPGKFARRLDRAGQMAMAATLEALESSGLKIDASNA